MSEGESDPVERTVQVAGGSTFTLSLPREWGVARGLEKGDSLYLYRESDRLVVRPSALEGTTRTTRIDTAEVDRSGLRTRIKSAYVEGYTEIRVCSPDGVSDELQRVVFRAVDSLVGMEVSEAGDEVVVRDHLDAGAVSLERSLVQIRRLALGMQRDAAEAVRRNDETLAQRVADRDDHVDRLFAFVARILHGGLADAGKLAAFNVDRPAVLYYYKVARQFELIADRAERIADIAETQSSAPDEPLGDRLKGFVTEGCTVVEQALRDDSAGAMRTYDTLMERIDAVEADLASCSDADAYWYATVVAGARRTAQLGLNIVNMTVESSANEMLHSGTQIESEEPE